MVSPEAAAVLQHEDELESSSPGARPSEARGIWPGYRQRLLFDQGFPTEELERFVREQKIDLAILGTHGRTGMKHLLMGSVAEELFRHLPCPVLTVGPNVSKTSLQATGIKHILFPTDLSDESQAVFPYLASLAAEYKASLTCFMSCRLRPPRTRMPSPWQSLCVRRCRASFLLTWIRDCPAEYIIDFGDAAERILAHAETGRADLIGLGVRKAGEITTHFRNTVAYRVVLQAHCPVLTARHSG